MPFAESQENSATTCTEVAEQLDLVEVAGDPWDKEAFLPGELSPIFWGSAMTNFGVEPLLAFLAENAAPPRSSGSGQERRETSFEHRPSPALFSRSKPT